MSRKPAKTKQSNNSALDKPKKPKAKPANVREYLNRAADVARDIVDTLGNKTQKRELLNANELANYRAACDALKTCRELYLRQQAIKAVKHDTQPVLQPLATIDTKALLALVKSDAKD